MTRTDTPTAWDERTTLTTFLDYVRATAHDKCAGLSDEDAARSLLPSSPLMTIGGLVNHLRWVEYSWIQTRFLGEEDEGPWTEEEPDREMTLGAQLPLAQVLAEYEAQCDRYRELVAGLDLDALAAQPDAQRRATRRCGGSSCTSSRRRPATTATSTCSAR